MPAPSGPEVKVWKVLGVDGDTGMETSIVFRASSASVARVMAERKGIHVAEVFDPEEREREQAIADIAREMGREPPRPDGSTSPHPPRPVEKRKGDIICPNPNCRYVGPPKRKARGSTVLLVILLVFFLVPGILYLLFFGGYRYYCPKCRIQIANDN